MPPESPSILIVDDEFSVRDSLYHWFRKDGFDVGTAENASDALRQIQQRDWDVALLDIKMPGTSGLDLLRRLQKVAPDTVAIMITAHGSIESAVEALKCGAFDYITKPVDPDDLSRAVSKALHQRRLATENVRLRAKLSTFQSEDELIAQSPQMKRMLEVIDSLAGTDVTVLIRGESGTGKELVARAVHARGPRRYFPLVPVNCGALPETLLESELFGHERGAFTGAQHRRKGKLEQADGGTLFLDEIGSISPRMQVELLRVLDTKEFARIGGSKSIRTDFRVVCATNQDLEAQVQDKTLREDLYFRINVFRIDIPPLREREGDIPILANHFLKLCSGKLDKELESFAPEAMSLLEQHSWPGNVRELKNVVERAAVLASDSVIRPDDLVTLKRINQDPSDERRDDSLEEMERVHVAKVLARTEWNVSQAARLLHIDRVTLYNKMKKHGLKRPERA